MNMPISRINTMLFPGGKRKAMTLSYDDGVVQDRRLTDLMRCYGIKGTFNLNSGLLGRDCSMEMNGKMVDVSTISLHEISMLYRSFEVATHAAEHSALIGFGSAALNEILEDRKVLEKEVPYLVRGHAYPFGLYDKNAVTMLKSAGIIYARTVRSTKNFELPQNFLTWHPTCHHNDPELMNLAQEFCEKEALFGQPQLFYVWGHAYEFDADQNWGMMEKFLAYISKFEEKIWMATNGDIVDYVIAYDSLLFSADGKKVYNPSVKTIWMESMGKIYVIPAGETIAIA